MKWWPWKQIRLVETYQKLRKSHFYVYIIADIGKTLAYLNFVASQRKQFNNVFPMFQIATTNSKDIHVIQCDN